MICEVCKKEHDNCFVQHNKVICEDCFLTEVEEEQLLIEKRNNIKSNKDDEFKKVVMNSITLKSSAPPMIQEVKNKILKPHHYHLFERFNPIKNVNIFTESNTDKEKYIVSNILVHKIYLNSNNILDYNEQLFIGKKGEICFSIEDIHFKGMIDNDSGILELEYCFSKNDMFDFNLLISFSIGFKKRGKIKVNPIAYEDTTFNNCPPPEFFPHPPKPIIR